MNEVSPIVAASAEGFDVERVREDFPALHQDVHGKPLVYLDSAATTLKPQSVIDAVDEVYARDCANIHRAVHLLSQRATARFEEAREKVRAFLNASKTTEIVFTRGTTEAVNLVSQSWGRGSLREGDEVFHTYSAYARGLENLLGFGYPANKIKWYRGGMQSWETLGLTTAKPAQE